MKRSQRRLVEARLLAAEPFIGWGLTIVGLTPPTWNHPRAGKLPLARDGVAGSGRLDMASLADLEAEAQRLPDMNLAVLGIAVVDTDNGAAVKLARQLGVTSDAPIWILSTSKGWHALYRPPGRDDLVNVTKNGNHKANPLVELDLLIHSPAIIPPSVHKSGHRYRWALGHSPADIPWPELAQPPVLLVEHWGNIVRPKDRPHVRPIVQPGGFEAAMRAWLESRSKRGVLKAPDAKGWIHELYCPLPGHSGRNASFGVNFELNGYICFSRHGGGTLTRLAEVFGIEAPRAWRRRHGRVVTETPGI